MIGGDIRFNQFMPGLLEREGGSKFVNHPSDPGGATKYGISLRFLSGEKIDIDGDGDTDIDDIRNLTLESCHLVYYGKFYLPMRIHEINEKALSLHVFDMGVNAGKVRAIKLLQGIVGATQDGIIGKQTLNLVNNASHHLAEKYIQERIDFYKRLVAQKPTLAVFLNGWINRVNNCKI
jgi:lysozyme family protein